MIQFEPDSPDYIRISRKVYDDAASKIWTSIKSENKCENVVSRLRLTRHYGPFVLYVISRLQQPACLVQEALHHRSIDVVYKLLILTSLLHPDSNFAQKVITFGIPPQNADFDCIIPETGAILHLVRVSIFLSDLIFLNLNDFTRKGPSCTSIFPYNNAIYKPFFSTAVK